MHRKYEDSGDHLRLVKYTPQISIPTTEHPVMLIPHTDFGTLTLLYSKQPGLEIFDKTSATWKLVDPRPDVALVIVGDTLVKFTNGLLQSCLHRVRYSSSCHSDLATKYSLGYFMRPENNVLLQPRKSPLIKSPDPAEVPIRCDEWIQHRIKASMVSTFKETGNWSQLRGTATSWE